MLHRLNHLFAMAPAVLLPWRYWVLVIFLGLTALFSYGLLSKFSMDMSLESWFQEDDPVKHQLDQFRQRFGSDDGVYVVYRPKDGDVFSAQSIERLAQLHNELSQAANRFDLAQADPAKELTRINRIDSLYNARYQIAQQDTLISNKLLAHDFPTDQAAIEQRREIASQQEGFKLAYFAKDYSLGGIRIKTDFGTVPLDHQIMGQENLEQEDLLAEDDFEFSDSQSDGDASMDGSPVVIEYQDMQMDEYLNFMQALRSITEQEQYQHFEFFYSGNGPMMEFAMESMGQASVLMLIMILVIILLLWFLFRSLSAVVWPVLVIVASAIWTLGLFSMLGITLSNMVTLTFMMILAVGIADCVHVLSTYSLYRRNGESHPRAMRHAYAKTGVPILLTTVTTMAGMSALLVSDIPQIGVFGVCSAVGVLMAFILTVFVLPVLLDIWHPHKALNEKTSEIKRHWLQPLLDRVPEFVMAHHGKIVLAYGVIFVVFLVAAVQVKVDSNFVELTREGSSMRVTAELIDEKMMGGQNMEVMLDFNQADALKDSEVLKTIDAFQSLILEKYPQYVVKTFALTDFVKETHMAMNQGQLDYKTIPDDSRLVSQLLYLFDNANPEDRANLVSDDYSVTHISIMLKNAGSYEYGDFFHSLRGDIDQVFSPLHERFAGSSTVMTGTLPLMMELVNHISWAQLKSFVWALLIISCLLVLALASVQGGLISIVPNMLPAIFTFGAMSLMGYSLDTDTLVIAPLIIGIAVDDTIHFMAHYRDAWFKSGNVQQALHSTIKEVGQAVTFTTLILAVGFAVLSFSDYLGLAKTGMFGSLAIVVALSCDLLLLPAIISWLKPDLGREQFIKKHGELASSIERQSIKGES